MGSSHVQFEMIPRKMDGLICEINIDLWVHWYHQHESTICIYIYTWHCRKVGHAGKIPSDEECDDESIDFGVAYFQTKKT